MMVTTAHMMNNKNPAMPPDTLSSLMAMIVPTRLTSVGTGIVYLDYVPYVLAYEQGVTVNGKLAHLICNMFAKPGRGAVTGAPGAYAAYLV
jgi:hypothetical protein